MSKIISEYEMYMIDLDCGHSVFSGMAQTDRSVGNLVGGEVICLNCTAIAQAVKDERDRFVEAVKNIPYKSRTATEFRRKTLTILEADNEAKGAVDG